MKIVITGGSGFVGKNLVKYLNENGNHEIISCQRKKIEELNGVKYKYFDYNFEIPNSLDFEEIDIFIHNGSLANYEKSKKELFYENVESLKNIEKVSKNAKHFIYISSSSVYQGLSGNLSVNEKIDENNLKNSYSFSKFKAEEYIQENFKNKYISILRPRAIYGNGDKNLVPKVLENSIFGYLLLPGNGKVKTSISEISKFCEFIYKISQNNFGGIYNFSSGVKTYDEIYKIIKKDFSKKGIIHIPIFLFKFLYCFDKNKYSYLIDTFSKEKILV